MWKGLPVPRVDNLNGLDYFISLDKDNYINMFNSSMSADHINIINPINCHSIGSTPMAYDSKFSFMKEGFNWPQFDAPIRFNY